MSFRNRCVVVGSHGLISLSVPVEKGRTNKAAYKDVRIASHEPWRQHHWRTIYSCYGKSPFFDFYGPAVEKFILGNHEFLVDLNLEVLEWTRKVMKLPVEFKPLYEINSSIPENLSDATNRYLPKNFQELGSKKYSQVFEDRVEFQSNLSILDLLFNLGPEAKNYLQQ